MGIYRCGLSAWHMNKLITNFLIFTTTITLLPGCSSPVVAVGSVALQMMGLSKPEPELPEEQKPPRQIQVRLQAGANLNADERQRAQAAVVRIYHLKDANAFWLASYDAFVQPDRDRAVLGNNLVAVQEVTLPPGQTYDVTDKVPRQAQYVGIVTLFYAPAAQRWRIAFDAEKSEKDGILIGIHSCAMTSTRGSIRASQAPGQASQPQPQWNSLVSVNCPASH